MKPSRRTMLQFAGGAAVGSLFTPAPWRLIRDSALLSESWPGIPKPARGPIRARFTNCSLCAAGCAMRARCVGDQPVSLAGVTAHPLSKGALCAFGVAAHHLPYHPARVRQGPVEEARAAIAAALARGSRLAVLDLRPGRTASWTYRRAMAAVNGFYVADERPATVDLASVRTVVSFGAPLVEGWGTPGNVNAARANFTLIAAEPVESRTAAMADIWLPIRPGTEAALAREVANGAPVSPEASAIARALRDGPAVALDADDSPAVLELNRRLGAIGRTIVAREDAPVPHGWKNAAAVTSLDAAADRSIGVLLIDESAAVDYLPWSAIERKLASDAVVVTFAVSREGYAQRARYTLPAPVFGEAIDDIPAAVDCCSPVFRLATPMVPTAPGVVSPAEFVASLAGLDAANALHERADAIHAAGRGSVFMSADAKTVAVRDLTAGDFWKTLNEGACWIGDRPPVRAPQYANARAEAQPSNLVITERARPALVSPLLSKIYQESNLRTAPRRAVLDPSTARAVGVGEGDRAAVETGSGRIEVRVTVDAGAPPGVVQITSGAGVQDLRGGNARVVRV